MSWELENNQISQGNQGQSSTRFSEGSTDPMRPSTDSNTKQAIITDAIYIRIHDLEKINSRIKKQLLQFSDLDQQQRSKVRDYLHQASNLANEIKTTISGLNDSEQQNKLQNILSKKVNQMQVLSNSLIYREKELLKQYKEKLEQSKLDNCQFYERKSLLEETDSEEDDDDMESGNQAAIMRPTNMTSINLEEEETKDLMLDEQDQLMIQNEMCEFQANNNQGHFVQQRTQKIDKVTNNLKEINSMYSNLNDIVDQQENTLNKIQTTIYQTKDNTKQTNKHLKQTLNNEKSVQDMLSGNDCGIMCLVIWFVVVVLLFSLDMSYDTNQSYQRLNY